MTKATGESEAYQLHNISEDNSIDPGHTNSSGIFIVKILWCFPQFNMYTMSQRVSVFNPKLALNQKKHDLQLAWEIFRQWHNVSLSKYT